MWTFSYKIGKYTFNAHLWDWRELIAMIAGCVLMGYQYSIQTNLFAE